MQINQDDFQLLIIDSQIDNLTLALLLIITCVLNTQMSHANPKWEKKKNPMVHKSKPRTWKCSCWRLCFTQGCYYCSSAMTDATTLSSSRTEVPASHLRTHQLLLLVRSSLVTSGGRLLSSCLFCFKLSCKNFYQVSMLYAASDVAPHLVKVLDVRFCCRRCSAKC